jgi:hypothetical protein
MHVESERAVGDTAGPAPNVTLAERPESFRFLIRDRDLKFPDSFDEVFRSDGTKIIRTPFRAPQANGAAERFVRTVRSECLDWLLILDQPHLERVLAVFVDQRPSTSPSACSDAASPDRPRVRVGDGVRRESCPAARSSRWCGSRVRPGGVNEVFAPYTLGKPAQNAGFPQPSTPSNASCQKTKKKIKDQNDVTSTVAAGEDPVV